MRDKFLLWGAIIVAIAWAVAFLIRADWWIPFFLTIIYAIGVYNDSNQACYFKEFSGTGILQVFF